MAIFEKEFNVKNGLAVNGTVALDADRDAFLKDITYTGNLTIGSVVAPKTNATQTEMEDGTVTNTEFMTPANIKQAIDMLAPKRIGALMRDMTGFEDRTTTNLTYNAASRTFTVSPVGASANIWYRGTKYTLTTPLTYTWADTPGGKYINLDPTTWTLYDGGATGGIENNLLVGYLYWDAINDVVIINGDERHGYQRDTTWHAAQHLNLGAVWRSGGNLTIAKDSQTDLTVGLTTPIVFADEDLVHTINHTTTPVGNFDQILNSQAQIPVLTYVNGQYLQQSANQITTVPWLRNGSILQYNPINAGVGTVSDVTAGKYISYWLIATNDKVFPVKLVAGRAMFDTQDAANNESFEAYGLPFPELVPMYQIVIHYNPTLYPNSVCRAVIKDSRILLDRRTTATSSFNASSHSGLTNLTTSDDHTQYVHTTLARDVTAAHKFLGLASVKSNVLAIGSSTVTPTTDGEVRASGSITASYGGTSVSISTGGVTFGDNTRQTTAGLPASGGTLTGELLLSATSPTIRLLDTTANAYDYFLNADGNNFYVYCDTDNDGVSNSTPLRLDGSSNAGYLFGSTIAIGQAVQTSSNVQFNSIGVGTSAPNATGEIRALKEIVAFYSDGRLKENVKLIEDPINKVLALNGVTYTSNSLAESFGYEKKADIGVIAQDVKKVVPEAVRLAPFDIDENGESKSGENYLTVQYEKLVPLLIEAIKELHKEIKMLKRG